MPLRVGLQLYSVRNALADSIPATLQQISDLGFRYLEAANHHAATDDGIGFEVEAAQLRTMLDDTGRPMMFINWNTDMGDGWEWSNVEEYPGYLKFTSMAYRMAINEIVYALTH